MAKNHFILTKEEYNRDFDLVGAYVEDNAKYLASMEGISLEEAKAFIRTELSAQGQFPIKDTPVMFLAKDKPACREIQTGGFLGYIDNIVQNRHVMAPTMTVYFNVEKKKSLLGSYIQNNIKLRKKDKHDMFIAELNKDMETYGFKKIMQNSRKIKNNSLSGAHSSTGTILYCKSIHPTLTSTCRSAASYGNANNEKFLAGNRHYWSAEIVIANILSVVNKTEYHLLAPVMERYNIHYPTPEEAMEVVTHSSRLYWRHADEENRIYQLLERLSPIERAAFVYIGDMFHLAKYNDSLVRDFIGALIEPATAPHPDPDSVFKSASADHSALANLLNAEITKGKTREELLKTNPEGYGIVANTIVKVVDILDQYADMIRALWVSPSMPASIYHLPDSIRRVAVVSDTDSTIFSNQIWTEWFVGKLDFSLTSLRVSYVTTFLTSQVVIHLLAIMSANMGVEREKTHLLSMKNEYFFPVFVTTSMSKHYYAYVAAQEGNVYEKMKLEIKGKNLRDSTLPDYVRNGVRDYVSMVMDGIMKDGKVSMDTVLRPVAEMEANIIKNVQAGKFSDMPLVSIKELSVYTDPENNPYFYHRMWEEVFAPKYGNIEPPPYKGVKITVDLGNPTKFARWVNQLADKELAQRMIDFMAANKKANLGMFVLPDQVANLRGIPEEMISAVNLRKLVYGTTFPFYMLLESLGLYITGSNLSRLVIDAYPIDNIQLHTSPD